MVGIYEVYEKMHEWNSGISNTRKLKYSVKLRSPIGHYLSPENLNFVINTGKEDTMWLEAINKPSCSDSSDAWYSFF